MNAEAGKPCEVLDNATGVATDKTMNDATTETGAAAAPDAQTAIDAATDDHPRPPLPSTHTPPAAIKPRYQTYLPPLVITLAFLAVMLYAARLHPYGTYTAETDFYQYYAPDADRLMRGEFPQDTYRGPGYALTLGLLTKITGDYFLSGKLISLVSAALLGWFAFLLFAHLFGAVVGVGAQLLALVGTQFSSFAVTATTDVFFVMLCVAAMAVFVSDRLAPPKRLAWAAALASFAYLTRYNGVFLVATFVAGILLLNVFESDWQARWRQLALFFGVFFLVASPWLIANTVQQGSPFYNTNHLNIATEFYPDLAGGSVFQEGTRGLSERFRSLGEVLRHDPQRIVAKYPLNLRDSVTRSIKTDLVYPWVGWLAVVGLALALLTMMNRGERRHRKALALVLLSGALYLLLVALTHWETRYYFYLMTLYSGLAAYALARPVRWLRARGWLKPRAALVAAILVPVTLFGVLWYNSFAASKTAIEKFLSTHPTEILAASEFIKTQGVERPRVVARKPHLAYFNGGEWLFIPQVKSLDEFKAWLQENPVDYVAFGIRERQARPELKSLADWQNAPVWLEPVWTSDAPPLVLYKPKLQ